MANRIGGAKKSRTNEQAQARVVILMLVSFLLGIAATAYWFHVTGNRSAQNENVQSAGQPTAQQPAKQAINSKRPSRPFVPSHPPVSTSTVEEVTQMVPNFASISLADGEQILREAALKKFTAAATDTQAQIEQARKELLEAQKSQSAAEQDSARKHLQQLQTSAAEELQQISAHLQTQIAALRQLKGTSK